ncbi:unnamed protein product, partial [Musa acuminata subsp. malaccensis]
LDLRYGLERWSPTVLAGDGHGRAEAATSASFQLAQHVLHPARPAAGEHGEQQSRLLLRHHHLHPHAVLLAVALIHKANGSLPFILSARCRSNFFFQHITMRSAPALVSLGLPRQAGQAVPHV